MGACDAELLATVHHLIKEVHKIITTSPSDIIFGTIFVTLNTTKRAYSVVFPSKGTDESASTIDVLKTIICIVYQYEHGLIASLSDGEEVRHLSSVLESTFGVYGKLNKHQLKTYSRAHKVSIAHQVVAFTMLLVK